MLFDLLKVGRPGAEPLSGLFVEQRQYQLLGRRRGAGPQLRPAVQDGAVHLVRVAAVERRQAVQHLIEHGAQTPPVDCPVIRLAAEVSERVRLGQPSSEVKQGYTRQVNSRVTCRCQRSQTRLDEASRDQIRSTINRGQKGSTEVRQG